MMNRLLTTGLLAAVFAAPMVAQGQMDAMNKVAGTGKLPAGWMNRFDDASSRLTQLQMKQAGTSLLFRTGPAGIFWNTKDVATGYYTVSGTFNQKKSMQDEAYGLFIGGQNLSDPTQSYVYFAIKPHDGTFLIKHRNGNGTPRSIVALTPDAAINKDAAGTGAATNALAIRVAKDSVHFYVNGKEVRTFSKAALGAPITGLVGLRINHNLDITVDDFGIKR